MFVSDGYITGALRARVGTCPVCQQSGQRIIDIAKVDLPPTMTRDATILRTQMDARRVAIGLTCGCYARFHRQVAHIVDSQLRAGRAM